MPLSTSRSAVLLLLTTLVLIGIMAPSATAFQSPLVVTSRGVTYTHKSAPMRTTPLFESPEDPTDTPSEAVEDVPVLAAKEEEASYPIDLPSPVLLGTSMILAIAATGSLFELLGGNPNFGFAVSAGIAVVGFPTTLFLFIAAIKKAKWETEEDDKQFLKNQ